MVRSAERGHAGLALVCHGGDEVLAVLEDRVLHLLPLLDVFRRAQLRLALLEGLDEVLDLLDGGVGLLVGALSARPGLIRRYGLHRAVISSTVRLGGKWQQGHAVCDGILDMVYNILLRHAI